MSNRKVIYTNSYYGKMELELNVDTYSNGTLYIGLMSNNDFYTDLTVNLGEFLPYGCSYVNANDFPDATKFINDNKLGRFTGKVGYSGFCKFPLYRFDMERIKELCPDTVNWLTEYENKLKEFDKSWF